MARFMRLSPTRGINLDQILHWEDQPQYCDSTIGACPSLFVTMPGPDTDVNGVIGPYTLRLRGEERETLLPCLIMLAPYYGSMVAGTPED